MPANDKIRHIVVLMMENRSFDHMLGLMKQTNPLIRGVNVNDYTNPITGLPPLPVTDGAQYQGMLVIDPGHDFTDVFYQMYGVPYGTAAPSEPAMNGFARSYQQLGGNPGDIMRCFRPEELPVLNALASNYTICDQWFSSVPGPTLPNRAFAHFGTSFGRLDMSPDYFRAKPSIYQRMKRAGQTAKIYYYARWSGTQGLTFLLSDQRNYFGLWGDFLDDCKNNRLPDYSFIEPPYYDNGPSVAADQHPDHNVRAGDNFLRQVYEAVRSNNDLWNSTLLMIVWDEHGGIFDHEIPPMVGHPDGFTAPAFQFDRLGVRVPAIAISPYIPAGVDHTVYEHTSLPATVTEQFIGDPGSNSPYAREQYANTLLHLLTLPEPRQVDIDFDAKPAAAVQPVSTADKDVSKLHLDQVNEVHGVLKRNHPDVARGLDPSTVKTEADASKFIATGLAAIHP